MKRLLFSVCFISKQHVSSSRLPFGEQSHGTNINLRDWFSEVGPKLCGDSLEKTDLAKHD